MEKYRFFDAVEDENGVYDREYNAQEFTDYFKALVTTGIMKGAGNELAVTTNGSNMITSIDTGIAFILGRYYENDSSLELTHDTEVLGKSRIDRIVIRMDLSTEARYVKAFIKKGVASASPVVPTLTQTPNLYEISLAQVKIVGGQTYIGVNDVTDERGKDIICPWAGSNILPNFNDEALQDLVNAQLTNLDGVLKDYSTGHLDNLTETGFYTTSDITIERGFPVALSTLYRPCIEVFKSADNWITQRFTYTNNQGTQVFIRGKVLSAWTAWQRIPTVVLGTGSPEGKIMGSIGEFYINQSGGANTTLYIKTSGTGNTGWTAK